MMDDNGIEVGPELTVEALARAIFKLDFPLEDWGLVAQGRRDIYLADADNVITDMLRRAKEA